MHLACSTPIARCRACEGKCVLGSGSHRAFAPWAHRGWHQGQSRAVASSDHQRISTGKTSGTSETIHGCPLQPRDVLSHPLLLNPLPDAQVAHTLTYTLSCRHAQRVPAATSPRQTCSDTPASAQRSALVLYGRSHGNMSGIPPRSLLSTTHNRFDGSCGAVVAPSARSSARQMTAKQLLSMSSHL
jgi:hypothetical protein